MPRSHDVADHVIIFGINCLNNQKCNLEKTKNYQNIVVRKWKFSKNFAKFAKLEISKLTRKPRKIQIGHVKHFPWFLSYDSYNMIIFIWNVQVEQRI